MIEETAAFTYSVLFLVFLVGGYGLSFTTLNDERMYDQFSACSNPTLRAVYVLENTYLFLYGSAAVEIAFMVVGGFGLIKPWSEIIDSSWKVMMFYGLLFLVGGAYMVNATAGAYHVVVSPIVGYDPGATQLRDTMTKLFDTTQMGLQLWIIAAALFILVPPIRRGRR